MMKEKKISKTILLVYLIFLLNSFALSGCGGGGGSGGGGITPQPEPVDPKPPATITNFSASYGTKFGDIIISWSAPQPPDKSSLQSYDIRYSNTPVTSSNYASCSQITQSIAPGSSGFAESFTFNTNSLNSSSLFKGANMYLAIRSTALNGYSSEISNVAVIKVPWQTQVKSYLKSDSTKFSTLTFGIQGNATAGIDSFDALLPLEHSLNDYYSYFASGSDSFLVNIHPDFSIDDKWTFYVIGQPLSIIKIDFPSFNSNGPIFNEVKLIEKTAGTNERQFSVPDSVSTAEFTLDGSGRATFDIYIN